MNKDQCKRIEDLQNRIKSLEAEIEEIKNESQTYSELIQTIDLATSTPEDVKDLFYKLLPNQVKSTQKIIPEFAQGFNHCLRLIYSNLR
jgi:chromosome segregation ATPase